MYLHLINGFLGSGKTTAIETACRVLRRQHQKAGVITNDQGITLVDSALFQSLNIPNRQVTSGCFCCRYDDLDQNIQSLIDNHAPDVIFAESVGSCTDMIATVLKPLLQHRPQLRITFSTFADVRLLHLLWTGQANQIDETVRYIYHKQLEEALVLIVNKIDLVEEGVLNEVKEMIASIYGTKTVLYQNSLDESHVDHWLQVIKQMPPHGPLTSMQVDYAIYGSGEAKLAWLDGELQLFSSNNQALQELYKITHGIFNEIRERNLFVGHLKFLIDGKIKISYTTSTQPEVPVRERYHSPTATLLINGRVQTSPDVLSHIVSNVIEEVKQKSGCEILKRSFVAFIPGFPNPTHRL